MRRVFRSIINTRAKLYKYGYMKTRHLNFPVISVGNLTVGGTGKTPLVITLASELHELGYKPVVLSRGYRRSSRGVVLVSRGEGPLVSWKEAGDEPFMIALRVPDVAVVVGRDRYSAGLFAEKEQLGNLFILDDGFQHQQLARDVDIVTIDAKEWAEGENLLPIGRWREPKSSIERADFACLIGAKENAIPDLPIPTFRIETHNEGLFRKGQQHRIESLPEKPATAFAGIAKTKKFFEMLEEMGIELKEKKSFPDHHIYRQKDLMKLGQGILITTEKDAVRLPITDFYFLKISAKILCLKEFLGLIIERIGSDNG